MTAPEDLLTAGLASTKNNSDEDLGLGGPSLSRLNPLRREFVIQYVCGPDGVRGIKYKAYLAAGYNAKDNNVASAAAYQLLQDPLVQAAVEEARKEFDRVTLAKMVPWSEVARKAQKLIIDYIDTLSGHPPNGNPVLLSANAVAICKEALDRGVGRPVQPVEHDIGSRLDNLIKQLSGQRRTEPSVSSGRSDDREILSLSSGDGSKILEADVEILDDDSERDAGGNGNGGGMGRDRG